MPRSKTAWTALCVLLFVWSATASADVHDLRINELQADNEQTIADDADEYDDWFELVNVGSTPVDLDGLCVTDDPDHEELHAIPGSLVVPAGGRIILWADGQPGQGIAHLPFRLSSSGEYLAVLDVDSTTVLDMVDFGRQFTDRVYQRYPDGSGDWTWGRDPSPNAQNTAPHHGGFLVLNELMPTNTEVIVDGAGDYDPWLELNNPLPIPVSLDGMTLRDAVGSPLPLAAIVMPAAGYQLLWLDGETAEGPDHIDALLNSQGGALVLAAVDAVVADDVIYPAIVADESYARIPDGGNWHTTVLVTPGQTNPGSLDPLLLINEFLASNLNGHTDEAGDAEDWVELYNPREEPLALAGISLTDDLTIPDRWFLPDMVLESHAFLLIWCDNDPEEGVLHATFKLSAAGEELGIFLGEELLDSIVFGAQTTDVSTGRRVDAGLPWVTFDPPTPGESNGGAVAAPDFEAVRARLHEPFPNPFNPSVSVVYEAPKATTVALDVFDLQGHHVRTLVAGAVPAGRHTAIWYGNDGNGRALPSGVYGVRMCADGVTSVQRVTLVR